METISQRLKKKREELNLSQDQLAKLAGMRQQSIQAIEAGSTKRPRYLVELARALKCKPEWLLLATTKTNHQPPNEWPFNQHQRKYHKWRTQ